MDFLFLELINSSWYIRHQTFEDLLYQEGWLVKLAEKWHIHDLMPPTDGELAELEGMRESFTSLCQNIVENKKLTPAEIQIINGYLTRVRFTRKLFMENGVFSLKNEPITQGWLWFMSETAASFVQFYASEAAEHLKICQNPECGWYFIDQSKRKNRKWCDETCASLIKVRRHRQKLRETKDRTP